MIEEHSKSKDMPQEQQKPYKILKTVDGRYQIMNILISQSPMETYYVSWDTILKEVLTAKIISKNAILAEIQACNDKGRLKDYYFHTIKNEVAVLERYSHEHIIKLYNCIETNQHCYQFYQYCPKGSIQTMVAKRGMISYEDVLPYWRQLLRGVCYLHSHGIVHRAIEPKNIYVNQVNKIKIANFKFAYNIKENYQMQEILEKSSFMAPELYSHARVTPKSDVWSLGVTLYFMLYGENPWPNVKEDDWHKRLLTSVIFPQEKKVPEKLKMSIARMLIYDPEVRVSSKELAHQFGI